MSIVDLGPQTNSQDTTERPGLLARSLARPPRWANERIMASPSVELREAQRFASEFYLNSNGEVNVFLVAGTSHPDYIGLTWLEFLQTGKRMSINLPLHSANRGYYLGMEHKQPTMFYTTTDGVRWYVDGDGNHRTAIARFDFEEHGLSQLRGVSLSLWRADERFQILFHQLCDVVRERKLPWRIEHENNVVARDDGPGWKLDRYENAVSAIGTDIDGRYVGVGGLRRLLAVATRPTWRRWFRSGGTR